MAKVRVRKQLFKKTEKSVDVIENGKKSVQVQRTKEEDRSMEIIVEKEFYDRQLRDHPNYTLLGEEKEPKEQKAPKEPKEQKAPKEPKEQK